MQLIDKHMFNKSSDTVMIMYTDKEFFVRKYRDMGAGDIVVLQHEMDGKKFRIKFRYVVKFDVPVPGFVKRFLPESSTIVQVQRWDCEGKKGRLNIGIIGVPAKLSCDMVLTDEGGCSVNVMRWDVSVQIPLVGRQVEELIANDIRSKSKRDHAATAKILEDY